MLRLYEILPGQLSISAKTENLPPDERVPWLRQHHITAVLNLWWRRDTVITDHLFPYAHHPMADGRTVDQRLLETAVARALSWIHEGHHVLVHCYGGRNRTGLVAALVVMRQLGVSGAEAVDLIRQLRPHALVNEHFVEWLRRLQTPTLAR